MRATQARQLWHALLLALIAVTLSSAAGTRATQGGQEPLATARQAAPSAYGRLPLAFVPNAGQLDRRVRYTAQAGSASVFLTRREAVVALARGRRGLALRLHFRGANPGPAITGARRSAGRVNYMIGNDPARWQTNLPTYGQVVYRELWPGVQLRVRGRDGQLKYEFRLARGADPARIRLAYRGQERLSLGPDGALRIETALGLLRDSRPVSYQPVRGRRVAVASSFALGPGGTYRFALGAYDRRYPLVIDPGLVYSTYLGGGRSDRGQAIAVDGAGSAYVTGNTASRKFPTTAGAFDRSYSGGGEYGGEAFVTKLNAAGSALVYSTYLGGSRTEAGSGIAVDGAGSVYVTGSTLSRNFPTTAGAFDTSYNGGTEGGVEPDGGDAFVTKLNAGGSALAYSTYLGDGGNDYGGGIAVDGAGSAYVTGDTYASGDFPTTAAAFDRSLSGGHDAFVTKLNTAGSALAYSTYLGGNGDEGGYGIAVDGAGSAFITGDIYGSADFPTTAGAFDLSYNGDFDAFVTKLNAAGSALAYSTYLGGRALEYSDGIAVDAVGSAYVTGETKSRGFPTTAVAFDRSYNGGEYGGDAFVTKLNAAGSALVYSTYLGGSRSEAGSGIAVDGAGSAYVTGFTQSNFPTTAGAFDRSYRAGDDAFVAKLAADGSALAYSTYLGGSGPDSGGGIAVDGAGSAYVTGGTRSTDFPTTAGAFDTSSKGGGDAFVTKLDLIAGPPSCIVPRLIRMGLAKAKRTIKARHCLVGRVRRVRSKRVGRVLAQRPKAGSVRRRGFRVNLIVGRR